MINCIGVRGCWWSLSPLRPPKWMCHRGTCLNTLLKDEIFITCKKYIPWLIPQQCAISALGPLYVVGFGALIITQRLSGVFCHGPLTCITRWSLDNLLWGAERNEYNISAINHLRTYGKAKVNQLWLWNSSNQVLIHFIVHSKVYAYLSWWYHREYLFTSKVPTL